MRFSVNINTLFFLLQRKQRKRKNAYPRPLFMFAGYQVTITFDMYQSCQIQAPDKSALLKITFLFLNQNICCGYSLMDKKIIASSRINFLLNWPYEIGISLMM